MFNANDFKRNVKEWVKNNSQGSVEEFTYFCEEQIPPSHFTANRWLIEQSVNWYKHVLRHRKNTASLDEN